jgi:hypothetical protein
VGDERVWPAVRPILFTDGPDVVWRDGKPWCPRHHVCLVRASVLGLVTYDEGDYLCHVCMKASENVGDTTSESVRASDEQEGAS